MNLRHWQTSTTTVECSEVPPAGRDSWQWIGQLSGRCSLRDLVDSISAQQQRLYHLGSAKLSRSNLARINENKPHELYQALFGVLLKRCQSRAPGHGFRFKNELYSMDATTIDLCQSLFPWASFRKAKGGIKLHVPWIIEVICQSSFRWLKRLNTKWRRDDVSIFPKVVSLRWVVVTTTTNGTDPYQTRVFTLLYGSNQTWQHACLNAEKLIEVLGWRVIR